MPLCARLVGYSVPAGAQNVCLRRPPVDARNAHAETVRASRHHIDECVIVCWQGNDLTGRHQKKTRALDLARAFDEGQIEIYCGTVVDLPKSTVFGLEVIGRCLAKFRRSAFIPPAKAAVWAIHEGSTWNELSR